MSHATHEPESPVVIDPEHDIDAKTTVAWLGGSLIFVILTLIVLGGVFNFSLQNTHYEKIDAIPLTELTNHRAKEAYWLANPSASNEQADAVMDQGEGLAASNANIHASTDEIIRGYLSR